MAAIALLEALNLPLLVVPGDHDVPRYDLFQRFLHPRQRWLAARPASLENVLLLPGLRLIGPDSVSRAQRQLDWAAGAVSEERRAGLETALALPGNDPIVVVCHHPLRHPSWASARRAPRDAEANHRADPCAERGRAAMRPSASCQHDASRRGRAASDHRGRITICLREWVKGQWTERAMQPD